jgi:hypothetical protein
VILNNDEEGVMKTKKTGSPEPSFYVGVMGWLNITKCCLVGFRCALEFRACQRV